MSLRKRILSRKRILIVIVMITIVLCVVLVPEVRDYLINLGVY